MADETTAPQNDTTGDSATPAVQQADTSAAPATTVADATTQQAAQAAEQTKDEATASDEGLLATKPATTDGAPESYEAFELEESLFDNNDETQGELQALAKELNLPQATAQASVQFLGKALDKLSQEADAKEAAWKAEQAAEWNKDPAAAEKTLLVTKALDHIPGLKEVFMEKGFQHDARLMAGMAEFGRLISEGKAITGGDAGSKPPSHPYSSEWK